MFGVWELFGILTGAGVAAGGVVKECIVEPWQDQRDNAYIATFVEQNTNPKLEKKLKERIEDPEWYDWVWERLERCKREAKEPMYLKNQYLPDWEGVGTAREPFRSPKGQLYVRNNYDNMVLDSNRNAALCMLMHTYGKMTVHQATYEATEEVVNRYKKKR